jgi:hypothetical protein
MFYLIQQLISNKKAFLTILFLSFIKWYNKSSQKILERILNKKYS